MNKIIEDRSIITYRYLNLKFKNKYDVSLYRRRSTFFNEMVVKSDKKTVTVYISCTFISYKRNDYMFYTRISGGPKIFHEIKFLYVALSKILVNE